MASKFNASQISIWNLLSSNSSLFNIPAYQRGYSWTKEEALTLFNDIKDFSKNKKQNQSYYIGNVILQLDETSNSTRKNVYQVVDGQQRITTMLLIISGLRNDIKKRIGANVGTQDDLDILNDYKRDLEKLIYFDSTKKGSELQLKVYNKDYDENMRNVIENTYNDDIDYNSKYYDNYHMILTQGIMQLKSINEIKLFIDALQEVVMVEVILSNDDNALVVFENINSKGHELTAHDLIKNYSYILASSISQNSRDRFDERITKIFDSKIKDTIGEGGLSTFWRVVCSILNNEKQPVNKPKPIYLSFKNAAFKKFKINGNTIPSEMEYKLDSLLNTIELNYEIYIEIMKNKGDVYHQKNRWERSLAMIADKTFDSMAPILFKIFNDYKSNRITHDDLIESIIAVNKYKLRLKLTYDGIKDLKNFSMAIVEYFNKEDIQLAFTKKNFLNYLENFTKDNKYRNNPDDVTIKKSLRENDIYESSVAIEILIEYEYSLSKNETIMADSKRKIQVEHIMPQKIFNTNNDYVKGWENLDPNEHIRKKGTLGNLTLTFDNQEMGNKQYNPNKKKILSDSNLKINNYFNDIDEWSFDEIDDRTEKLIPVILKQWEI